MMIGNMSSIGKEIRSLDQERAMMS